MVKRVVYDCELCEAKEIEPVNLSFILDIHADGAGQSYDLTVEYDLCVNCARKCNLKR